MMKYILLIFLVSVNSIAQDSVKLEYSTFSDIIPVSKINISIADSLYQFIEKELPFIDFGDCNNCSYRAHLMAAILEKNFPGVNTAKVWLFADYKRESQEDIYRYKSYIHLSSDAGCNKWGYHVAPILIIEQGNSIDTMVIDHSTQRKPEKLKEWAEKLVQKGSKGFIIIKDKKYYKFPDNENNRFIDTRKEWIDDKKEPLYDDNFSISLEKVLLARYGFWEPWTFRKHYKEFKELLE
ncbi:MAG: hypothetical protein EHM58_18430 [Ignavibacteriae bacterium]|nr:MAG: hypothetical protein EHM58_18430 [Ignavibacteriota bacterium]